MRTDGTPESHWQASLANSVTSSLVRDLIKTKTKPTRVDRWLLINDAQVCLLDSMGICNHIHTCIHILEEMKWRGNIGK